MNITNEETPDTLDCEAFREHLEIEGQQRNSCWYLSRWIEQPPKLPEFIRRDMLVWRNLLCLYCFSLCIFLLGDEPDFEQLGKFDNSCYNLYSFIYDQIGIHRLHRALDICFFLTFHSPLFDVSLWYRFYFSLYYNNYFFSLELRLVVRGRMCKKQNNTRNDLLSNWTVRPMSQSAKMA